MISRSEMYLPFFYVLIEIINFCFGEDCNSTICRCGQPLIEGDAMSWDYIPPNQKFMIHYDTENCIYQIECMNNLDLVNYKPIQSFLYSKNGSLELDFFKIFRCTFLENTRLKYVMNDLKIKLAKKIELTRNNLTDINSEIFTGLHHLEMLRINSNTINKLPDDLLYDLKNLIVLNIKKNGIEIPQKFFTKSNLTQLFISENYLPENTTGFFTNLKNITHLEMYDMKIERLQEYLFEGLTQLKILELSVNRIESLPKNIFKDLHNLEELSLKRNNISFIDENVFVNNKNLIHLRLDESLNKNFVFLEKTFWNLINLNELNLNYNDLTTLPNNLFTNLTRLKTLHLNNNKLTTLPDLKNLILLTKLYLENNKLETLPLNVFSSLEMLNSLFLSGNNIKLTDNIFHGLKNLKSLDLGHNNLTVINSRVFNDINGLENLILSYNNLDLLENSRDTGLGITSPIQRLNHLQTLKLNNNRIKMIFLDWKIVCLKLNLLDLSYNNITELKGADFNFLQHNITIHLEHNQIYDINTEILTITSYSRTRNIKIHINYNPLHCGCNLYNLYQYYNKIKRPDTIINHWLISNSLRCDTPRNMKGTLVKDIKFQDFNCTLNDEKYNYDVCPRNSTCYFRPFTKTLIVDGSFKKYTSPPEINIETIREIYDTYTSRINIILNMSGNSLTSFLEQNNSYKNIVTLDLSNNHISNIEWLPDDLQVLYLHNNSISNLNATQLNLFNTTKFKNMTLYDNPWNCNCDLIDFMNYLQDNYHKVIKPLSINCVGTNEILLNSSIEELCPSQQNLIISICITLTILSVITAVIIWLFYRYNMEIKVWLYAHQIFLWFITEEELDKDKIYDAFISYSHKDEDLIVNEILPKLEGGERPYKLCLHFRNWQPGEFITTNITRSINESRRTIVILSPSFLESEWAKMEFKTAHVQALSEGRARVIVIIFGELPMNDLDEELKAYLNTNTYVKWGDPWFWDKLRYALPHNLKHSKDISLDTMKTNDKLDLINNSNTEDSTPPADKINTDPILKFHINEPVNNAVVFE